MGGISEDEFFDVCGWDPITYTTPHRPDPAAANTTTRIKRAPGFLESRRIATDNWRVHSEPISGREHPTTRFRFVTPKGTLSMVLESDPFTTWVVEPLIKEKRDIDLIGEYVTAPEVRRGGGQPGGRGVRPAGAGARHTSAASTSSASPAPGRTPLAWSASSG